MRAGPILVAAAAQGNQVVSVSDLILLAINAAKATRYRSSRRPAGQCCVATALARVAPSLVAENGGVH